MEWKKSQKTDGDGDTAGGAWTPGKYLEVGRGIGDDSFLVVKIKKVTKKHTLRRLGKSSMDATENHNGIRTEAKIHRIGAFFGS